MITSLAPQMLTPPPITKECTAVTTGTSQLRTARKVRKLPRLSCTIRSGLCCSSLISTPAQKPLPAPRSSRQRTSGLKPMLAMTTASSFQALLSSALTGGRSRTTSPMCA